MTKSDREALVLKGSLELSSCKMEGLESAAKGERLAGRLCCFTVTQSRGGSHIVNFFQAISPADAQNWLDAFTAPVPTHTPVSPSTNSLSVASRLA